MIMQSTAYKIHDKRTYLLRDISPSRDALGQSNAIICWPPAREGYNVRHILRGKLICTVINGFYYSQFTRAILTIIVVNF